MHGAFVFCSGGKEFFGPRSVKARALKNEEAFIFCLTQSGQLSRLYQHIKGEGEFLLLFERGYAGKPPWLSGGRQEKSSGPHVFKALPFTRKRGPEKTKIAHRPLSKTARKSYHLSGWSRAPPFPESLFYVLMKEPVVSPHRGPWKAPIRSKPVNSWRAERSPGSMISSAVARVCGAQSARPFPKPQEPSGA